MIVSISNVKLHKGMTFALPFGKTAKILSTPRIGRKYVEFTTEWGPTRLMLDEESEIIVTDPCECDEPDFAFNNVCRKCGRPLSVYGHTMK